MTDGTPHVSLIYPELQDETAVSLGRAFVDDPAFKAIVPDIIDEAERARILSELFRAMFALERKAGQPAFGVVQDGKVIAAAVTEGAARVSFIDVMIAGLGQMPRVVRALGLGGTRRALTLFRALEENHPHEPHLYLQLLGVNPDYQRRHFGTALLDHLRDEAALHPRVMGVYLETAKEANVPYYSARGYEVIGEMRPLGVRMWRMYQRVRR